MLHETLWISEDLGKTATPCPGAAGARVEPERGGTARPGHGGFDISMAASLAERRRDRVGRQARSWASAPVERSATRALAPAVMARRHGLWLLQRTVDLEAHRDRDATGNRGPLSSCPRLEGAAPLWLELSGPRASGAPTGRTRHCALEALPVAGDKNKPDDLGPIWPSWMRAAFSLSRRAGARGHRKGRRRSSATPTNTIGSRRWRRSLSRRTGSIGACTSGFNRTTSPPCTWPTFCGRSCTICEVMSSCCGIKARFTGGRRSRQCSRPTPACRSKSSQLTPQNSIPSSSSGTTSKGIRPTAYRGTSGISAAACTPTPVVSGALRRNCARSSGPLPCLLHHERTFFIYAKFNNAAGDLILSARTNPSANPGGSLCRALVDGGQLLVINW